MRHGDWRIDGWLGLSVRSRWEYSGDLACSVDGVESAARVFGWRRVSRLLRSCASVCEEGARIVWWLTIIAISRLRVG